MTGDTLPGPSGARPGLAPSLTACLAYRDRGPELFKPAAAAWHARWCRCAPSLTLDQAIVALDALMALDGPDAVESAQTLRNLSLRHGLPAVAAIFQDVAVTEARQERFRSAGSQSRPTKGQADLRSA
jgi:hypothetical protein